VHAVRFPLQRWSETKSSPTQLRADRLSPSQQ
jgi:hypothetical protein